MGTKKQQILEIQYEQPDSLVPNFGYTIVSTKNDIDLYDFNFNRIKSDNKKNEFYLIPNVKGHKDYIENDLKSVEAILLDKSNFTLLTFKPTDPSMENSLAREFLDIELIKDTKKTHVRIIYIANRIGLMTSKYKFAFKNKPMLPLPHQECDNLKSWYDCYFKIKLIIYFIDNINNLKLKDFGSIYFENDDLIKCDFNFSIDKYQSWVNLAIYKESIGKIKSAVDLESFKSLLKHHIIKLINTELHENTYLFISHNYKTNKMEKKIKAKNVIGILFLELAKYFWGKRIIVQCLKCKKDLDLTFGWINKRFHDECYGTFKMAVRRGKEKGLTEKEIAKKLNVKVKDIQRRRP